MSRHSVDYPSDFSNLRVRELLELSQSNVTVNDHELGLKYAAAAYDKGLLPVVAVTDETAAGEAAAKAGLRAEQAGYGPDVVDEWFSRSFDALSADKPKVRRERVATYILVGRVLALREQRTGTYQPASKDFSDGNKELVREHKKGTAWDPYATMLDKHWAAHEAMTVVGSSLEASTIAMRGIYRAIRAKNENVNTPEITGLQNKVKHARFVIKQVLGNTMSLGLAVSRPLENNKPVQKLRRKVALSILG